MVLLRYDLKRPVDIEKVEEENPENGSESVDNTGESVDHKEEL